MKTLTPFMLSLFFSLLCGAVAPASPSPGGGLSGSVSMGAPSPSLNADQVKEVVATGIGVDAQSAEKQALTAAVQQAVGSYLDTKTITDNEEVIKDRVLSLSNGFVSKYDVISGPKQRDDKLFEVTVKAQVQGGQVVAKLKEVNLIKGEVAGQNLYAQNLTQMISSDDACKMLNEKLPELFVNCIKMEFVDKDGKPLPNSNPVDQIRDDKAEKVNCTWYIKYSVDKKVYTEQVVPLVKKCFDSIFGTNSESKTTSIKNGFNYKTDSAAIIVSDFTRSLDSLQIITYPKSKYILKKNDPFNSSYISFNLMLKSASGELISEAEFSPGRDPLMGDLIFDTYDTCIVTPFCNYMGGGSGLRIFKDRVVMISANLPMNDVKDVSNVEVKATPPEFDFKVKAKPTPY